MMPKFEMESDEDNIDEKEGVIYPPSYHEKKMISVNDIGIDTTQSRHGEWENDELDLQLMGSVEEIGLIYDIMVRPTDSVKYGGEHDKPYVCVAGSRRFHSMIATGHIEVPCVVRDLNDIEAVEISLSENIGRKDLTDYQEQRAVNLWYKMLLEKSIADSKLNLKDALFLRYNEETGKNAVWNEKITKGFEDWKYSIEYNMKANIIKEIAKKLYGENRDTVHQMLSMGDISPEVQVLLKTYHERTPQDLEILKSYGIDEHFVMGKKGFLVLREIEKKFLGDSEIKSKTQKIFEMIKKSGIDKEASIYEQAYILKDIRDELGKGKSFDVIMEEKELRKKEFEMEIARRTIIRVPPNYIKWHERACSELRKSSSEIISYIYLEWLKNKAQEKDW